MTTYSIKTIVTQQNTDFAALAVADAALADALLKQQALNEAKTVYLAANAEAVEKSVLANAASKQLALSQTYYNNTVLGANSAFSVSSNQANAVYDAIVNQATNARDNAIANSTVIWDQAVAAAT